MSLHSGSYIRDMVGHQPTNMFQLRTDEVQVFNRMGVENKRRISFPSRLADIRESVWLQEKERKEESDNNNNGWRRIQVSIEPGITRENGHTRPLVEEPVLFTYHNVQNKSCLVEEVEEEEDEEEEEEWDSEKEDQDREERRNRISSFGDVRDIQTEARRRFSVGDPCFQFPAHPYFDRSSDLYIQHHDRLNYIVEEEEGRSRKMGYYWKEGERFSEEEDEEEVTLSLEEEEEEIEEEIEESYTVGNCDDETSYIVEEEEDEMRTIPIVIEQRDFERKPRRTNSRVEDTSSIGELIKDLSEELAQLKRNREMLETLKQSSGKCQGKEKKITTYAELVERLDGGDGGSCGEMADINRWRETQRYQHNNRCGDRNRHGNRNRQERRNGFGERNGFCERNGLGERNGFDERNGFGGRNGLSERNGLRERSCSVERNSFVERNGFGKRNHSTDRIRWGDRNRLEDKNSYADKSRYRNKNPPHDKNSRGDKISFVDSVHHRVDKTSIVDKLPPRPELRMDRTRFYNGNIGKAREREQKEEYEQEEEEDEERDDEEAEDEEEEDEEEVEDRGEEKYELMSDPSACDELWLLPQQVLAMDVDLLQAELSLPSTSREGLRFARASPSKSTFWMYTVQGRLRAC